MLAAQISDRAQLGEVNLSVFISKEIANSLSGCMYPCLLLLVWQPA